MKETQITEYTKDLLIMYNKANEKKALNTDSPFTQNLLKTWFRKVHEVFICIIHAEDGKEEFEVLFTDKKGNDLIEYLKTDITNYDFALELGLQKAFEIIKK